MVWHDSPYDEHPVADVSKGQNKIWQVVDAVVKAGHWDDTVFLLTWDDWGGWDDHVVTPNVEHTPDGVQHRTGAEGIRVSDRRRHAGHGRPEPDGSVSIPFGAHP